MASEAVERGVESGARGLGRHRGASGVWRLLLAALVCLPQLAWAGQLYVNGVAIGRVEITVQGLEGVTFERCASVKIEAGSHVRLDCPGYDLRSADPSAPLPGAETAAGTIPAQISKRYWLVTEQSQQGLTQYDIDLYINSKWIKRLRNDEEQVVEEVTKHLKPGPNKVLFAATKNLGAGRRSIDPNVFFRVIIGEGDEVAGSVVIERPVVDWKRTAAESENVNEERELVAR